MLTKNAADRASGIFTGITGRWNPLAQTVHMLVKVDANTIKVPIDYRQVKYVQMEYKIGSKIELRFYDGGWHVMSHQQPTCDMSLVERRQTFES